MHIIDHQISAEKHLKSLKKNGWTADEYEIGSKLWDKGKNSLEQPLRGRKITFIVYENC